MTNPSAKGPGAKSSGSQPKVIRVGIIQGGKIIEERTLRRRQTISIGYSPRAMFIVTSEGMMRSFDLFELSGSDYYLRFTETMGGVVQLDEGSSQEIQSLKDIAQKRGDAYAIKLSDRSRGKVKIGDVTVLFQFRDAPSDELYVLPPELRRTFLSDIDVQFTAILAAVSVSLVSLAAYARNQPYYEPTTIEELDARFAKLIMPDRDPEPLETEAADQGETKEKAPEKKKEPKKEVAKASKGKSKGKQVSAEEAARAKKEAITKAVAGKGLLGVIGTKGKSGALQDVFGEGDFGEGALGDAFSGIQGVDIAEGGGKGSRGGGSGEGVGIGDLATSGGGSVDTGKKVEGRVRGNVSTPTPEVEGDLSAATVKREMRKNIRALKDCYERQLKRFPNLAGKIVLSFEILETGRVSDVNIEDDSVGNAQVRSCILGRAKYWRFPRPSGGTVFVSFPLVFTPSG